MRYDLADGSEVVFETTERSLVTERGGQARVIEGGELERRLAPIARAAQALSRGLREGLDPHEIELNFGVKISGKVSWWFIASSAGEAAIAVTLRWKASDDCAEHDGGVADS